MAIKQLHYQVHNPNTTDATFQSIVRVLLDCNKDMLEELMRTEQRNRLKNKTAEPDDSSTRLAAL